MPRPTTTRRPPRRSRPLRQRALLAALALLVVGMPTVGGAQCSPSSAPAPGGPVRPCGPPGEPSRAGRHAAAAGINVALGALAAGLRAWHQDRPVLRAALTGAAGGAVTYGGKLVIASPGRYAGLAGRQIGAVGASIVRNAGDGRPALAGVVLPLGPVRLYVNEPQADGSVRRLQPRLDLAGAVALVSLSSRQGASLDFGASLEAGAPVVRGIWPTAGSAPGTTRAGTHRGGVVGLYEIGAHATPDHALAHELVHVAQYDMIYIALASPLERALWRRAPDWLAPVGRYVDLGLSQPLWSVLNGAIRYEDRPWEREAYLLTDR